MSLSTTPPVAYATGKKINCLIAPLAHTGLKRMPIQPYLGRILYQLTVDPTQVVSYVFGTPHGLLFTATHAQLNEPTAEQYRELDKLEGEALAVQKILYGGDTGLREFLTVHKKGK